MYIYIHGDIKLFAPGMTSPMVDVRKRLRSVTFPSTASAEDNKIQAGIGIKFKIVRRKIERGVYDQFVRFTRLVMG